MNSLHCVFRVLILFLSLTVSQSAFSQRFNTDAVNGLWHLVDQMKADRPLTDSMWDAYYHLYGNQNYIINNRDTAQATEHRKYLEIIFRPSKASELKKLMNEKQTDDILANLLYIKSNEFALRTYTTRITSPAYLAACIALAKSNLPAHKYNKIPKDLTIYINALTFDVAVQSPNMYFGLSIVYEYDRFKKGAIAAHELDHQLRVNKEIENKVSYADSTSFSIIDQVNNEGTADLIDKTVTVANSNTLYDAESTLHWILNDARQTIKSLDSAFLVNSQQAPDRLSYRNFRELTHYSSGHIPGFYMAQIIVRNGGKAELIRTCDNPFQFFYQYNAAAKMDKTHPPLFSTKAINYLKALEKRVY